VSGEGGVSDQTGCAARAFFGRGGGRAGAHACREGAVAGAFSNRYSSMRKLRALYPRE